MGICGFNWWETQTLEENVEFFGCVFVHENFTNRVAIRKCLQVEVGGICGGIDGVKKWERG